jgi:hypothetical protein
MITLREFTALAQEQKIGLLTDMLKDAYTTSPVLGKMYAYVTSELPKDTALLDEMYTWLLAAGEQHGQDIVQKNVDASKKIQAKGQDEYNEKDFDDLLAKL